jgi:xanthine dehydrogenase large subunit
MSIPIPPHESAHLHVSGEAVYVDDILTNELGLEGYVYYSPVAHANIKKIDLTNAKNHQGVLSILSHKDIPGHNQMGPIVKDECILAIDKVEFIGQAIFLIAAETEDIAREAAKLIEIEFEELPTILTIEQSKKMGCLIAPPRKIEAGNIESGFEKSPNIVEGTLHIGAQEHWYLETQSALAIPGEDRDIKVISSTQHPSETQLLVAESLNLTEKEVEVEVRRMGGAFGGKETQANAVAIWAALLASDTRRPVKIRLFRDDDQKMTGKRHRYITNYKAGYNNEGQLIAVDLDLNTDAGYSTDLSMAVLERAMMHSDNSYYIPNIRIIGNAWKTNLPSNTAFRGFGGPQGVAGIETIIDIIARKLGQDSAEIRFKNFYQKETNNHTPYQQLVENNRLYTLWDKLIESSNYKHRRNEIDTFNSENEFYKKGLALTPVKFGISFTTAFLNQAGALVLIYKDGSVLINHGGTEMGQGLNTKIINIAAKELGISNEKIKVNATNTAKVPNTSATAASAGTDLNGFAVKNAIDIIKERMTVFLSNEYFDCEPKEIIFENNFVYQSNNFENKIDFQDAVMKAYMGQVGLSSTGFYKTPDVHFDREKGQGKPYHYFAYGMSVTEVLLDTLNGHHKMSRVDIVHDVGDSINARIDKGQVEGGFIQGVGWCTTEECKWDDEGNLLNHSPDTYKIPNVQDMPKDFRVELLENVPNDNTIRKSKAVGEPPLMLCFSAWLAIKDAISAVGKHQIEPEFSLPATNETILLSLDKLRTNK